MSDIKIFYFASVKEALGASEETFSLTKNTSVVEDLIRVLSERDDQWKQTLADKKVLIAVNQEIVNANQKLNPGDEVAFFPPVTGG